MPILPFLIPIATPEPTPMTVQLRLYETKGPLAFTSSAMTRKSLDTGHISTLIEPTKPSEGELESLAKRKEIKWMSTLTLQTLSGMEATSSVKSVETEATFESRLQVLPTLLKNGRIQLQLRATHERVGSTPATMYDAVASESVKEGALIYFLIAPSKKESQALLVTARVFRS
jgi:hypothetical protein